MTASVIPLFVISYNRGKFLDRCIKSYRRLHTPVEIIIHDNGSQDSETLEYLDQFEADGIEVFRGGKIRHAAEIDGVNDSVNRYFARHKPSNYVVTDCDIDLSVTAPDALDVFRELMDVHPGIACVGPMIRIRDVPRDYPLFNEVMNRHIHWFWHKEPKWVSIGGHFVAYQETLIDTTFALHRAGEPFQRLKHGIRVYEPFDCQHLDWYLSEREMSSTSYFTSSSKEISHWNNQDEFQRYEREQLRYQQFIYVDVDELGRPREVTEMVSNIPIGARGST